MVKQSDLLMEVMSKKETRVEYCKHDFFAFCMYYFPDTFNLPSADFHKKFCKDLQDGKDIVFEGFRECGKTVYVKYKLIHNIVYRLKRFIILMAFNSKDAEAKLFDIAVKLQTNKRLIADFGQLFYADSTERLKKSQRKTVGEFITENEVKVQAIGMGESTRGFVFGASDGEYRPDLVIRDDIDVEKSVYSEKMIEKNYNFIKSEVMGGLAKSCQKIFLCNVIKEDGIGVRFKRDFKGLWEIYEVFYKPDYNPRPAYFTDEFVEKKRRELGETSWQQNYCGVPFTPGNGIIKRERIQYYEYDIEPEYTTIGVDPAISKSEYSDAFAIVVVGHIGDKKYIIDSITFEGKQKDYTTFINEIERLYNHYDANLVVIETNAFQQVLGEHIKERNLATKEVKANKDKVTRLMEYQIEFERGNIFFNPDKTHTLVDQLVRFPNAKKDDEVDAMVYGLNGKGPNKFIFTSF